MKTSLRAILFIGIIFQIVLFSSCSTNTSSQSFVVLVNPSVQKTVNRLVFSAKDASSTMLNIQVADGTMQVRKSDVLSFSQSADALKLLNELQPYHLAYIMQEQDTALRRLPSLGSSLVQQIPAFSSLSILSLPQGEQTVTDSYFFSQNRQLWIKARYSTGELFTDGWLLISQKTKLLYEDESNSFSPQNSLLSLQKALFWTRKSADIIQEIRNLSQNDLKNHTLFFDIVNSKNPRFTIKENSSELVIPVSRMWPYLKNQFLVPSYHLEISLASNNKIDIHYPNDTRLTYVPISTKNFLQETQYKQSYKNNIYKILTRFSNWNSELHGKIIISVSDAYYIVFMKWFLPLYLSKYFERSIEGVLNSAVNFDYYPGTSLSAYADYVIFISIDEPPKSLFFTLQELSQSSFSLQRIAENSISISSQNIIEGELEGSRMIFLGINN